MKKIPLFIVLLISISTLVIAQSSSIQKPENFPTEGVELIKSSLVQTNYLDTVVLLETDFSKLLKDKSAFDTTGFVQIKDERLIDLMRFKSVKSTLALINDLDQNLSNEDLKSGILFKLEVLLKNEPISFNDLMFVYNHWGLDKDFNY